jgi:UDPglucose 6-dehydrogenase
MKITIIGTGYVGLVTGACLAELGNVVHCLDIDHDKINLLNQGHIPIHEPGLDQIVERNRLANRLIFSTNVEYAIAHGDILYIAVGTPANEDGSADLHYVLATAQNIGYYMNQFKVIVNKSTVPVGTADKVRNMIHTTLTKRNVTFPFSVISNPEFLKEGSAVDDFMRPDRIIIGCDNTPENERAKTLMKTLYAPFNRNHERTYWMDVRSAEFTKYAANAMLATRISFMNELANLAEKIGADIESVRHGIGSDPRIGYSFLYAGCGYGGSCFPKDVRTLEQIAKKYGQSLHILNAVEKVNQQQKHILSEKIFNRFGRELKGNNFAVWGLSFKPNTNDMREASSRDLISDLIACGATVHVYDPIAMKEAQRVFALDFSDTPERLTKIHFANSPYDALHNADALILVTEWKVFQTLEIEKTKTALKTAIIFDGRNVYEPDVMKQAGFEYYGIGRTMQSIQG